MEKVSPRCTVSFRKISLYISSCIVSTINVYMKSGTYRKTLTRAYLPMRKNCHRELTVTTVVTAPSPMITAQSRRGEVTARSQLSHGEVTAQSRRGHSSVTARSQLSHGEVTAQSRHLQYDHGSVTARSQLNHGPGHSSVTAGCDHFGHRELTVSSHGGEFLFSWVTL